MMHRRAFQGFADFGLGRKPGLAIVASHPYLDEAMRRERTIDLGKYGWCEAFVAELNHWAQGMCSGTKLAAERSIDF